MAEPKTAAMTSLSEVHADKHSNDDLSPKFPAIDDVEAQDSKRHIFKRIPIYGIIGVLGALSTFVLSWLILHFCEGQEVWVKPQLQPAAWLSIVLSVNAIFLRMAISEGVTVSWWYRASKPHTTVGDLHSTWNQGTGPLQALASGRSFSSVALATLFVGTIPLNGFFLQNAVSETQTFLDKAPMIQLPMWQSFPEGYSAELRNDSSVGTWSTRWADYALHAVNHYQHGSPIQFDEFPTGCNGYCDITLRGVGFLDECSYYRIPYDFPLDSTDSSISSNDSETTIFSMEFGWNADHPNTIFVNTVIKDDSSCSGQLLVKNCTLHMGTVDYTVGISTNAVHGESKTARQAYLIAPSVAADVWVSSPNVTLFPSSNGSEVGETTFGGFADALGSYFNSTVNLRYENGHSSIVTHGGLASIWPLKIHSWDPESGANVTDNCQVMSHASPFPLFTDATSYALETVRSMFLFASIFGPHLIDDTSAIQKVVSPAAYIEATIYRVEYRWWIGSLCLTLLIILFILPTFWGYWNLGRRTTMSPAETARAFQTASLERASSDVDTATLIKRMGDSRINSDMDREIEMNRMGSEKLK